MIHNKNSRRKSPNNFLQRENEVHSNLLNLQQRFQQCRLGILKFPAAFQGQLQPGWDQNSGYLTLDGEHHNEKGSAIILDIFTQALCSWINHVDNRDIH